MQLFEKRTCKHSLKLAPVLLTHRQLASEQLTYEEFDPHCSFRFLSKRKKEIYIIHDVQPTLQLDLFKLSLLFSFFEKGAHANISEQPLNVKIYT